MTMFTHPNTRLKQSTLFVCMLLCLCLAVFMQYQRKHIIPAKQASYTLLPIQAVKVLSLGHNLLLADFFWLQALQHFGESDANPQKVQWLGHLMDTITDLDPHYLMVYVLGTTNLTFYSDLPEMSAKLLHKGIKVYPDNIQLYFYLAYNYFFHLHEYTKGAMYMEHASQFPDAPGWYALLAARMHSQAGDLQTALVFLNGILQSSIDEQQRDVLEKRISCLQHAIAWRAGKAGHPPQDCPGLEVYFSPKLKE